MSDEEAIKAIESEFEAHKNTLPKEPEGDVKKEYIVGCENASDWQYIHEVLIQDGTLEDNIPNHCCESVDDCPHSATRGVYLLTSSEVEELKKHNKVFYVHINYKKYPGTYASTGIEDIASAEPANKTQRYSFGDGTNTIESQRELWNSSNTILDNPATSDNLRRDGYHLTRHMQKDDPWYGSANTTVINSTIEQYGTGKDVDVIVADEDAWFGHVEFQNNLEVPESMKPTNYVGGNVLPGTGNALNTSGTCDVLDLVLDSPYYIDPDFFNASPSTRLETRWDGTTVPIESVAVAWWNNNSTSYRSSKFVSPSNGGTATGNNDFGILSGITSSYSRYRNNGSYNSRNMGFNTHGTPCMSQTYGRTQGWAYNANKWFVAIMGGYSLDYETYFDLLKIYHQIKPINPTYNTKDPTISSNSWGKRHGLQTAVGYGSAHYYFHAGTTGSGSVEIPSPNSSNMPEFLDYYWGNQMCPEYLESHATVVAAREMTESGVIFVAAAGNQCNKQVKSNHDDFDNYISTNSNTALSNATTTNSSGNSMPSATWYNTANRRGFPTQAGVDRSTTPYTYPVISVGCLDHEYDPSGGGYGKERKVGYSNMGNEQDVFAAGDYSLGAMADVGSGLYYAPRWDAYYDLSGNVSNNTITGGSVTSMDGRFGGTSSACPIFAGLLATKVQYNRAWNYSDVRTWIQSLGQVDPAEFYYGSEGETANASEWSDRNSLHGALGHVAYDAPTESNPEAVSDLKMTGNGLTFSGVSIKHT
tara:strand:+ start:11778 stop:14051 length:2274 start_codon:yes stop_codon:yes gene_type:complete